HLGVIISEAEHAGADVRFVTEPLDDSPEGQLIRFVRGYAAKVEHEKIKERMERGRLARARAGKPLVGCRAPYGYQWNDGKSALLPHPETAPIVQRIFRDYVAGKSLRTIGLALAAEGIPAPKGGERWFFRTVHWIVQSPIYAGEHVAYRWKQERVQG